EWIVESAASGAHPGIERGVAILIIGGAGLWIAQRLISLTDFFERFFGGFIARIFVRMKFYSQLAVRFFDFFLGSFAFNSEDFVVVALGHSLSSRLLGDYHTRGT